MNHEVVNLSEMQIKCIVAEKEKCRAACTGWETCARRNLLQISWITVFLPGCYAVFVRVGVIYEIRFDSRSRERQQERERDSRWSSALLNSRERTRKKNKWNSLSYLCRYEQANKQYLTRANRRINIDRASGSSLSRFLEKWFRDKYLKSYKCSIRWDWR